MMNFFKRHFPVVIFVAILTIFDCGEIHGQSNDARSLGHEALSQGAYSAATYLLYADYLKNPSDFHDLEVTAYLLSRLGEYEKADTLIQQVQATKDVNALSDSLRFYYYSSLARVEYQKSHYITTIKSLSKLPEQKGYNRLMADSFKALGLYDEALKVYQRLFIDEDSAYVHCLIAQCYRERGDFQSAITHYSEAKRLEPNWAIPYYGIGWSYELSGDDDSALKYYNEGLAVDQTYSYLFLMRGELYLKKGDTKLAEKDFDSVLRKDRTIEDGTCRQYALHFLGRDEDALNWMNGLINYQPNYPGHYYDKACLCCRMGRLEEAIEAIQNAFEKGYRCFAHLNADDDIDPLKSNTEYIALYNKYYALYLQEIEQLKDIL